MTILQVIEKSRPGRSPFTACLASALFLGVPAGAQVNPALARGSEDAPAQQAIAAAAAAAPVANVSPVVASSGKAIPGFWKRFGKAYWDDWHPGPPAPPVAGAPPDHRGYDPPVSNPPYPFSVWPIGGTVWIGYNNATQYPLTTALQTGPHGDWWKKANIQVYGWADLGMNISTSSARPYGNLPAA